MKVRTLFAFKEEKIMPNSTNAVNTVQQGGIEKIVEILNSDIIFIPKFLFDNEDVYEESKLMFSVVFTESLQRFVEKTNDTLTVSKEMKRVLHAKSDSDIQYDCICPASRVRIVRQEVLHLINHENISRCMRETGKGAV